MQLKLAKKDSNRSIIGENSHSTFKLIPINTLQWNINYIWNAFKTLSRTTPSLYHQYRVGAVQEIFRHRAK